MTHPADLIKAFNFVQTKLHWLAAVLAVQTCCFTGCNTAKQGPLKPASVSASAAADDAISLYDTSGDGQIDGSELAAAPAISGLDTNGDSKLSRDELVGKLEVIFAQGATLSNVTCQVVKGRQPLRGATVKFTPVEFLGDKLMVAEGTTDAQGYAIMSIVDDQLPDDLKGQPMMQVGLYDVEITKGSATAKFGHAVDPTSRTGFNPTFDLNSAK